MNLTENHGLMVVIEGIGRVGGLPQSVLARPTASDKGYGVASVTGCRRKVSSEPSCGPGSRSDHEEGESHPGPAPGGRSRTGTETIFLAELRAERGGYPRDPGGR